MIVRISGEGQFEVPESHVDELNRLDDDLTKAVDGGDEAQFTAALQVAQGCDKPVLIRVETQGSHGYRPTDKRIAELADQYAFAAAQMGMARLDASTAEK